MRRIGSTIRASASAEAVVCALADQPGLFWLDDGRTGEAVISWAPSAVVRWSPGWVAQARALLRPEPPPPGMPFAGGLVGWVGYEAGASFEPMPERPQADVGWRLHLGRYDGALHRSPEGRWTAAGPAAFVEQALEVLAQAPAPPPPPPPEGVLVDPGDPAGFRAAVAAALEDIAAGDYYVINLARRLRLAGPGSALGAYRRLRQERPARFGALLTGADRTLLSSSPELYLTLRGSEVRSEPIKGTRPLGSSPEQTAQQAAALREDPKERAELTMIVDLVRNDLGRVCAPGSVRVGPREVQALPGLVHAWQAVDGTLRPGLDAFDLLAASFPPGSVTGAPKVRVMERIHALEPWPRGAYTGALGCFADGGDTTLAVAIRVAQLHGGEALVHVGCGVVADSDPDAELAESTLKAQGLLRALTRPRAEALSPRG